MWRCSSWQYSKQIVQENSLELQELAIKALEGFIFHLENNCPLNSVFSPSIAVLKLTLCSNSFPKLSFPYTVHLSYPTKYRAIHFFLKVLYLLSTHWGTISLTSACKTSLLTIMPQEEYLVAFNLHSVALLVEHQQKNKLTNNGLWYQLISYYFVLGNPFSEITIKK